MLFEHKVFFLCLPRKLREFSAAFRMKSRLSEQPDPPKIILAFLSALCLTVRTFSLGRAWCVFHCHWVGDPAEQSPYEVLSQVVALFKQAHTSGAFCCFSAGLAVVLSADQERLHTLTLWWFKYA